MFLTFSGRWGLQIEIIKIFYTHLLEHYNQNLGYVLFDMIRLVVINFLLTFSLNILAELSIVEIKGTALFVVDFLT